MRAPVVLHAMSSLDQQRSDNGAVPIIKGLSSCVKSAGPLRNENLNSPDYWAILQKLRQHHDAGPLVFDMLHNIATSDPSAVTADNYEAAVSLANDFATAGSVGAVQEQRRDGQKKGKGQQKQAKPEENGTVTRGVKAIGLVYHLTNRIPSLIQQSHLERTEAWAAYWSPSSAP